jgi:hypothetical protein
MIMDAGTYDDNQTWKKKAKYYIELGRRKTTLRCAVSANQPKRYLKMLARPDTESKKNMHIPIFTKDQKTSMTQITDTILGHSGAFCSRQRHQGISPIEACH